MGKDVFYRKTDLDDFVAASVYEPGPVVQRGQSPFAHVEGHLELASGISTGNMVGNGSTLGECAKQCAGTI